jgi:drug/metabolite transporter (DMT)-like permease
MKTTTGIQIVVVMLLWASCFPLVTVGIEYAPHLTFAAMRATVAGVALLILAFVMGEHFPRNLSTWCKISAVGIGSTSLGFFGMFHAAEFVSPGIATVIASSQPLLAALLARVVLKEHLGYWSYFGLALGFVGIAAVASPEMLGSQTYTQGIAYIILAALGVTVGNVAMKSLADDVDALMGMGLQLLVGSVPLALLAYFTEDIYSVQWSGDFVSSLVALSLFGTALVFWLWFSALKKTALSRANAFSFLVPVFGLTIAAVFFGETIGMIQAVGIALTLSGVSLVLGSREVT